mmetsp:Transcript_67424/g.219661  ORF Transcript_67424/g.219661 Transcript_67424/m.219661 type:complete len:224 (+) Transcript_67424:460-1131(+)
MARQQLAQRPAALEQAVYQEVIAGGDDDATFELRQAPRQRLAGLCIEVGCGLVQEEDVCRLHGQRCELEARLLPPAQSTHGHADCEVVLKAEVAEDTSCHYSQAPLHGGRQHLRSSPALGRSLGHPCPGLESAQQIVRVRLDKVLNGRQLVIAVQFVQLLAVVADPAAIRMVHCSSAGPQTACAQVEESGLARAVLAQHSGPASAAEAHLARKVEDQVGDACC